MAARAAVYSLLSNDPVLQEYGINSESVFPAQSLPEPVPVGHPFLVMRWQEVTRAPNMVSKPEVLTVWAHHSERDGADYAELMRILERVSVLLTESYHVYGEDGVMTSARWGQYSPDLDDPILKTITKNAEFTVLSR